jgi:predicted ribosomally synthesized peptide with SipW-like signal peptide
MTDSTIQGADEEYVLVPRRKVKVSRARKGVIGFLVVSAVAAIAGGGTFASFTASTTNANNVFQTGFLELSNDGPGALCVSSDDATNIGDGSNSACDALFTAATLRIPGASATANLTLKNNGNIDGFLQTTTANGAACASTVGDNTKPTGAGNLCTVVNIEVQEYTDNTFGTELTGKCFFPASATQLCSAVADQTLTQFFTATDVGVAGLGGFPAIASAVQLAPAAEKFYQVRLSFPSTGVSAAGLGNENTYQNRKLSNFSISWRLVDENNFS